MRLHRQSFGMWIGMVSGLAAIGFLSLPGREHLHAVGPMNAGHEDLACESCHWSAPGTLRQQVQTAVHQLLGYQTAEIDIGYRRVTNEVCASCHDRPDDRHPIYRFTEPRFAQVRVALHPESCTSCHDEHRGVRVSLTTPGYCVRCHTEMTVKDDPLDIPHKQLLSEKRWDTCLGCHDFHGNHEMKPPRQLQDARTPEQIRAYFDGDRSPYPARIRRAVEQRRP